MRTLYVVRLFLNKLRTAEYEGVKADYNAGLLKMKLRKCHDVPKFLKRLDAIQKRTAKSKLQLA